MRTFIRKTCDVAFFKHHCSREPKKIRWFFNVEMLSLGDRRELILLYEGVEYDGIYSTSTNGRYLRFCI